MCATANVFVTGAVPEQQFSTLIPWMMEKYGKKVYTIAADYNFGQISAEWVRSLVAEGGGTMVGEEFIPLSVSQFSQTIQNIQKAAPDFVVTLLVGANQASYYEQQAAAQVNLPMASSVNVGQAYEHKRFKPPALKEYVRDGELRRGSRFAGQQRFQEALSRQVPGRRVYQPGSGELIQRRVPVQGGGGEGGLD